MRRLIARVRSWCLSLPVLSAVSLVLLIVSIEIAVEGALGWVIH